MDIIKFIREHNKFIEQNGLNDHSEEIHYEALKILKHERIIHLIVTMFTTLFCFMFLGFYLFTEKLPFLMLFIILLILVGFYILHYFRLENITLNWERVE